MSIVLVTFPGAPKPSDEAKQKDDELNKAIENEVVRKFVMIVQYIPLIISFD